MMNEKTAKLLPKEMQVSGELKSEPSYNQRPILPVSPEIVSFNPKH